MQKDPEEFYANLRQKLSKTSEWPAPYLYKFILPSEASKIKKLVELFDNMGAVIKTKESSKGKYTSVSIHLTLNNPDEVIKKYKEVGQHVQGVISL
ncbi:MAG: DUF493 family protein [Flavobacteriaceae bacterium]|nr:DUF493 family protein [Flavobacteriaceae bacterium]